MKSWTRKQRTTAFRRPQFECLDSRTMMAGDVLSALAVGTTTGGESITRVVVQNGNRYTALDFNVTNGPIDVDPLHVYVDNRDIFTPAASNSNASSATLITKFDSAGLLQWKTQVNAPVTGLAADSAGNLYISGSVIGANVSMGPVSLTTNVNNADAFLAKLSGADGGWSFVKQLTNSSALNEVNSRLAVAADGATVYVTSLWSSGGFNSSLTKVAINGNVPTVAWTDQWSVGNVSIADVHILADTQVVIAGVHRGEADFDPGKGTLNLSSGPAKSSTNAAGFAAVLNSAGGLTWAKNFKAASSGGSQVSSVAVDASGIALAGLFSGTVDFDPNAPVLNLANRGGNDVFFVKLSQAGSLVTASSYGSAFQEQSALLVAVPTGGYVLTSRTLDTSNSTNYTEIRKLDTAGLAVWKTKAESALVTGLAVDALSNQLIITGGFASDLYYTTTTGIRSLLLRPLSSGGQTSAFALSVSLV